MRLLTEKLHQLPQALPLMLHALDFYVEEPKRVVVAGPFAAEATQRLLHADHSVYQPNKVVLGNTGLVEEFAKTLPEKGGPTIYLCTGKACMPPTNDPAEVRRLTGNVQ